MGRAWRTQAVWLLVAFIVLDCLTLVYTRAQWGADSRA